MATILHRILPPLPPKTGFAQDYCYFSLALKSSPEGIIRRQNYHLSVEYLERTCTEYSAQGFDTYFAPGRYKEFYLGRKAANVDECRALWADIDAGKNDSKYANAQEALRDLFRFVQNTGLEPTIIVSSGAGLHVYWTFTKSIPISIWKGLASYFHRLCKQEELDVDPTRAEDLASVLRVPGTRNTKSGNTVKVLWQAAADIDPVAFLQKMGSMLRDTSVPVQKSYTTNSAQYAAMSAAGLNETPSAHAEDIVKGCPQILTAGLCAYPQWFAAFTVLRRCIDGNKWAHTISAMDKTRYDSSNTDRIFYSAHPDAPSLCSSFEKINPALCAKCPHYGRIKTPLQIAKLPKAIAQEPQRDATVTTPTSPLLKTLPAEDPVLTQRLALSHPSYQVDRRGIVWKIPTKDAQGVWTVEEKVICTSRLYYKYAVYQTIDGQPKRSHVFEVEHPNGRTEELLFIIDRDLSSQSIMHWFANGNMFPVGDIKPGVFMGFMNAYLQTVVNGATELPTLDQYGWQDYVDPASKQTIRGFVTGRGIVTETGLHSVRFGSKAAFVESELKAKGSLEQWKHIPQMYKTLDQKIGQLAMCMSFAAPFLRYGSGEATNGILSLWSSASGLGKTHVLRFAASVWGNPYEQFISREASSVARTRRMSILNNLPVFMDEVTDINDEDMYSLAYTIVGGKEKDKLKSSGDSYVQTGKWKTMTFTTANRSFKDAIARRAGDSDATLLRVMEYECDFKSYEDVPAVNQYITACIGLLKNNYGWAGPELMYQIMQRPDRLSILSNEVNYWIEHAGFRNNERFMSYPLAIALKVGRWCVEFGLLDYDMDALEKWVLDVFVPANRRGTAVNAPNFMNLLGMYLIERQPGMLVVKAAKRDTKTPDPGSSGMPDNYLLKAPRDSVVVRVEQEDRRVIIAHADLARWCRKQNASVNTVLSELSGIGVVTDTVSRDLTKGISWLPSARVKAVIIERVALDKLGFKVEEQEGAE